MYVWSEVSVREGGLVVTPSGGSRVVLGKRQKASMMKGEICSRAVEV